MSTYWYSCKTSSISAGAIYSQVQKNRVGVTYFVPLCKVCIWRHAISATGLIPPARCAHADGIRRTNLRRPNRTSAGLRSDLWQAGRATGRRQLIAARWSCIPYRRSGRQHYRTASQHITALNTAAPTDLPYVLACQSADRHARPLVES